jgi:cytochrome c oxidase subunit 2
VTRTPRLRTLGASAFLLLAACAKNAPQTTLKPKGDVARRIDHLIDPVFIVAGVIFLLVEGLILFAVLRFRARPGSPDPEQIHGNTRLEVGWTLLPALILLAVAVPTIKTIFDIARKPADALNVTVTAHQFWWEMRYDDLGVVTANELRMPTGKPVEITLKGVDVIHSFWVPALGGKTDVVPGRENHMHYEADAPGQFLGQCTEFCGLSHANMRLKAIALTPADFDAWVAGQKVPAAAPASSTPAADGLALFSSRGCAGCHTVEGVSTGNVGPNLTHFASRTSFAGSMFERNDANLRKWLADPQEVKPGNAMKIPGAKLNPDEITKLIAYLDGLR